MLTARNLSLFRNNNKIFSNINFSIPCGKALVIKGKNGSGKTSVLRMIMGLLSPSSGELLWCENNLDDIRDDFNLDSVFIGHQNFLKPELSVAENLKFYANLRGDASLIDAAVKFFGLDNKVGSKLSELSAGTKQRALLANLLFCPATIWVLDEPFSYLDTEGSTLLIDAINTKVRNNGIVVLTTHGSEFTKLESYIELTL